MVRKPHSFFPNSFPLPLSTSYTLPFYFLCTFDSPSRSLGRKMEFWGPGRVTDGARPFHPRMVRKPHSYFSVSLSSPLRTSDAITCHFVAFLIPPRPVSWQKNEILGSRPSNGRRAAVSPCMFRKPHSFFSVSLHLSLSTSYTLICYLFCTFDSPSPSLGRKMVILGL